MARFEHSFNPTIDQHRDHDVFLQALREKRRISLKFFSKEDGGILERECAPMDFGPSRRTSEPSNRYHSWDFDSDTKVHTLSLKQEQIVEIKIGERAFQPGEFVTWSVSTSPWFTPREWADLS